MLPLERLFRLIKAPELVERQEFPIEVPQCDYSMLINTLQNKFYSG
jgi:hypothetical protein